jgi:hypothetical protein
LLIPIIRYLSSKTGLQAASLAMKADPTETSGPLLTLKRLLGNRSAARHAPLNGILIPLIADVQLEVRLPHRQVWIGPPRTKLRLAFPHPFS